MAGQRQYGQRVRDARVDVEPERDRHGRCGGRLGAEHAVAERGREHGRGGQAGGVDGPGEEEVNGARGAEAVEEIEGVLDRLRVGADHVGAEPDRGAGVEQGAVTVARPALVEVKVARVRQRAEHRGRRVLHGQRERDRRSDGRGGAGEAENEQHGRVAHGSSSLRSFARLARDRQEKNLAHAATNECCNA